MLEASRNSIEVNKSYSNFRELVDKLNDMFVFSLTFNKRHFYILNSINLDTNGSISDIALFHLSDSCK